MDKQIENILSKCRDLGVSPTSLAKSIGYGSFFSLLKKRRETNPKASYNLETLKKLQARISHVELERDLKR